MLRLLLITIFLQAGLYVSAQWSANPQVANTPLCTATSDQYTSHVVPDGSGGAITVWYDQRSSGSIYYNRINSAGVLVWSGAASGLFLATGNPTVHQVIPNGSGGAYVCWSANDDELYVQQINSAGAKVWGADVLLTTTCTDNSVVMCFDGSGGIVIAWDDFRNDLATQLPQTYLQRVNSAGTKLWAPTGVRPLNTTSVDAPFGLVPDGSGGVIVALVDTRSSNYNPANEQFDNINIYAQRLNAAGNSQWGVAGVPVCTQTSNQFANSDGRHNKMVSDGSGGVVIGWEDFRNDPGNGSGATSNTDVFTQRLNAAGTPLWAANGVAVCTAANDQFNETIMADGAGGAVFAWEEERSGYNIYSQRINGNGAPLWTANGMLVAAETDYYSGFTATPDATNTDMIVTWDAANVAFTNSDIKAQKIVTANGSLPWGGGAGTLVCGRTEFQYQPIITHNGGSGAIIIWTDDRNEATSGANLYANRVLANGTLPVNFLVFDAKPDAENVRLTWRTGSEQNTSHFNVQRSTDGLNFSNVGKVTASGNSSVEKDYAYTDAGATALNVKRLYYRLEQLDLDAKKQYSNTVFLPLAGRTFFTLAPNPARDKLTVSFTVTMPAQEARLYVVNTVGKTVVTQALNGGTTAGINLTGLPKGVYWLTLMTRNETLSEKFIKE